MVECGLNALVRKDFVNLHKGSRADHIGVQDDCKLAREITGSH
jgi:hypothetical protein